MAFLCLLEKAGTDTAGQQAGLFSAHTFVYIPTIMISQLQVLDPLCAHALLFVPLMKSCIGKARGTGLQVCLRASGA